MRMNTDALVLKVTDTGESDRLLTLLTSEYGVLRAFANRAKKINSKFLGATQSLCYADFSIYTGRDSYIIDDANAKEVFFGLRSDIERLALGQYFCALSAELAPEMEPAGEYLRVVLNSLHMLEKQMRSPQFLKAVTELKLLSFAGFMPDLTACRGCSSPLAGETVFNPSQGCVYCRSCANTGIVLTSGVLAAMRHICSSKIERIYSFSLPEQDEKRLAEATEKFLLVQTGHSFKALEFYKTINT